MQSIENKLDLLLNVYSQCLKKGSSHFTLSSLLEPDLTSDYHSPTDQRELFPSANTLNISHSDSGHMEWALQRARGRWVGTAATGHAARSFKSHMTNPEKPFLQPFKCSSHYYILTWRCLPLHCCMTLKCFMTWVCTIISTRCLFLLFLNPVFVP